MPQSKTEKRLNAFYAIVKKYGNNYHVWPQSVKHDARGIYLNLDNANRVKIIDLVNLKLGTGFICFFDRE